MSKAETITPEVAMMSALIEQYAKGKDAFTGGLCRCTPDTAVAAAEALRACGFRLQADDIDRTQNEALRAIEGRLARIEGYMVVKP